MRFRKLGGIVYCTDSNCHEIFEVEDEITVQN